MEEMKNMLSLIRFFPLTFQHYLNVLSAVSAFKSIDFKDLIRFLGGKSNHFANTPRRKIKRGNKMCVCDNYPTGILISITPPPHVPHLSDLPPSHRLLASRWQDDMHRVIDQQLMDKYQDEWRSAPSSLSGSSKAHGGQTSRRAHRVSDRDKKLFSFFKKN